MSQTIDDRVVQLEFDNGQFEKGVQESLTTLQKLKGSLNMDAAAKNLTALGNAASRFNLDGISNAVDMVGEKFSYMKYAGLVALSNLVTGAMQAGKRLVSALTGPIITGGWNRAMNLEQANFMMKGLLKTDDAVAAVMKDVNESVDGTAYSLDAAAKVAAQFAASGVKAGENMLPSLKAVAGTAAMTNSSFEEIGQIFTTVAGQGKLMTYQMRQLEFRGLNVAATLGEQLGKSEAEIRDMVTKGKISFDMFSDAMNSAFGEHAKEANNTFSGAMANVRAALGRIGAEFATPFIHNVIPVLNSFRLAINATKATLVPFFNESSLLMEKWSKTLSKSINGYTKFVTKHADSIKRIFQHLITSIRNISGYIKDVITPIKEAFNKTFTRGVIGFIQMLSIKIEKFTNTLSVTGEQSDRIRHIFQGFFSIFDSLGYIVGRVSRALFSFMPMAKDASRFIGSGLDKIASKLLDLNVRIKSSDFLSNGLLKIPEKLKEILSNIPKIGDDIKNGFGKIKDSIKDAFDKHLANPDKFLENVESIKGFFEKLFGVVKEIFSGLADIFDKLLSGLPNFTETIVRLVEAMFDGLANAIHGFLNSQTLKDLMDFAKSGIFIVILENIREFTEKLKKKGGINSLVDLFTLSPHLSFIDLSGLQTLATTLREFKSEFIDIQALKTIGPVMLEIAAALLIISSIDKDKVVVALGAMTAMLGEMTAIALALAKFEDMSPEVNVLAKDANMISEIGKGILMVAGSIYLLSLIDPGRLAGALLTITILMGMMAFVSGKLIKFVQNLSVVATICKVETETLKISMKGMSKLLIRFALSLMVLVLALKVISTIPFSNLVDSLIALTVVMAELLASMYVLSKVDIGDKVGKTITKMMVSLLAVSLALKILSTIPLENMKSSLVGVFVSLATMVIALKALSTIDADSLKRGCAALLVLSIALLPLAAALKIMSTTGYDGMAVALMSLVVSLAAMCIALKALSMIERGLISGAIALSILSVALISLSLALKIMSTTGYDGIAIALTGLVISLIAMCAALKVLSDINPGKLIVISMAFVVFSAALLGLAIAFKVMSTVDYNGLAVGLTAIIISLLAITVVFAALQAINPGKLIVISAAILLVCGSLIAIAMAIAMIASFPVEGVLISILALVTGIALLAAVLGVISLAWTPVLIGAGVMLAIVAALAAGFALLGLALIPVGKGFEALALGITALAMAFGVMKDSADTIKSMILPLSGLVLLFGILSPLLALIGAALAVVGIGVILIGAGAAVAGAGMMLMAKAMELITKCITGFAQALVDAGNILVGSGDQIKTLVLTLLALGGTALIAAVPLLVLGIALIALGSGLTLVGTGLTLTAVGIDLFIAALTHLAEFLQVAIPLVKEGLAKAFEFLKEKIHNAWEFIKNIDWDAVKAKLKEFGAWLKEKAAAVWEWLKEQFPIWKEAIKAKLSEWGESIKEKLHEKWEELKDHIKQRWEEFKNSLDKWKDDLIEKGRNIIQGLIDGIKEKISELTAIPSDIYEWIVGGIESLFDINSPSKKTYWDGLMVGEGFTMGLDEGTQETGSIIDNLGNIINGGLDGIVDMAKSKVTSYFFDWTKASEETENSLSHLVSEFANSKISISEFNGTIGTSWNRVKTLVDELNRLTGEYKSGRMSTEEYKAATANLEQEVYDLIGDVNSLREALNSISTRIQATKAKQDELTYAYRSGRMGLHEYTEQYNRYQNVIDTCTEMQINLAESTKEVDGAANDASTSLDKYSNSASGAGKASKSAAKDMQDSLAKTLESQLNIFDKFEAKSAMSKQELLDNMKSQINGMTNWAGQMDKLATMGIDQGLYQKLAEMGPQGAQYVGAFASMTAEEMAQANELWAQSLVLPGNVASGIMNSWSNIGNNIPQGMANGIAENADAVTTEVSNMDDAGQEQGTGDWQIKSPSRVTKIWGYFVVRGFQDGIIQNTHLAVEAIQGFAQKVIKAGKELLNADTLYEAGANVTIGLANGIKDNIKEARDAAEELSDIVTKASEKKFQEKSPSRVFMQIGKYLDEGLAIGISGNSGIAVRSMETMNDEVMDAMRYTVATIATAIQDGIDDPVITPVLDLSRVNSGIRTLNNAFSMQQALGVAGSMSNLQNGQSTGGVNFIQNNYSPKALSRTEIYRQTNNQLTMLRRVAVN